MTTRAGVYVGTDRLAHRLRSLRDGAGLTQSQIARALGDTETLSVSTISTWEGGKVPPERRLVNYARLFCAPRLIDRQHLRLPGPDDLNDEERTRLRELEAELLELRQGAIDGYGANDEVDPETDPMGVWHFPDGAPVTIVCSELPEGEWPRHASKDDPDYVWALSLGDLDTLIDIHGEIRAENPSTVVRIRGASDVREDEITGHLILVGGIEYNSQTHWHSQLLSDIPIRQVRDEENEKVDLIEARVGDEWQKFGPKFDGRGAEAKLVNDVGLFMRTPNPHNPLHTLTVCSGVFTRGVRGTARCFIDPGLRTHNLVYLADRFSEPRSFALVLDILVRGVTPTTPDLWNRERVLFAWPPKDSAEAGGDAGSEDAGAIHAKTAG